MFKGCEELEYLDLSSFDTSYVTDMRFMFDDCCKLKEINGINTFNTINVQNMFAMFEECKELEYLDLSNFNTSNVTDMSYMFDQCNKLQEIKGIDNFDTSNVTQMEFMFNQCYNLKEIKGFNKFNTLKVINMKAMFQDCYLLEYLDLSNFNTSNVIDMKDNNRLPERRTIPCIYLSSTATASSTVRSTACGRLPIIRACSRMRCSDFSRCTSKRSRPSSPMPWLWRST